jgi:hypothetical protein
MQEIRQIVNKLTLTLDNPKSVKRQIKQINLAQKQLRAIKKEINELIRNINQDASQAFSVNLLGIGGLHSFRICDYNSHCRREVYRGEWGFPCFIELVGDQFSDFIL